MQSSLKRILVLGGGPVGWLAAAYVNRILNRFRPGQIEVSVLESAGDGGSDAGAPGSRTLVRTLKLLGIDEQSFLLNTDATFMHGSRLVNWLDDPRYKPSAFQHPLDRIAAVDGIDIGQLWIANRAMSPQSELAYAVSIQPSLCERSSGPKLASSRPFEAPLDYSYQLDAALLMGFLRDIAMARGVQAIAGRVESLTRDERGNLRSVHTRDGRGFEAELFIDCDGTASRLLDAEDRDAAFVSYDRGLLCDRILSLDAAAAADGSIPPYFSAHAAAAGWIGETHLATRRRLAYVYSSAFISDLAAERELRAYAHVADGSWRSIARFLPGRRRDAWRKNCIAVGAAAGAIEPLVASDLGYVEAALRVVVEYLPLNGPDEILRSHCNAHLAAIYDTARDLVVMHYCLTRREDTSFWRANRHDIHLPERLRQDLGVWRHRLPGAYDRPSAGGWFGHDAFQFVLAGMARLEPVRSPYDAYVNPELASATFRNIEKMRAHAVSVAPDHGRFIRGLRQRQIALDLS